VPLELRDRVAMISGVLTVEEVEPLVDWLRSTPRPQVNLRRCTHLHTGGLQALLHFRAKITAGPSDPFLSTHVMPLLLAGRDRDSSPRDAPEPAEPTARAEPTAPTARAEPAEPTARAEPAEPTA
jgi:hypothetical protein